MIVIVISFPGGFEFCDEKRTNITKLMFHSISIVLCCVRSREVSIVINSNNMRFLKTARATACNVVINLRLSWKAKFFFSVTFSIAY